MKTKDCVERYSLFLSKTCFFRYFMLKCHEYALRGEDMTRKELDLHLKNTYDAQGERLFPKYPTFAVYRHFVGRKWFAVIMELSPNKIGLTGDKAVTVVNLKVDPLLGEILRTKDGYYPAYHMNKVNWVTAVIDENTDRDELFGLIAMSYRLTNNEVR